MTEVIRLRIVPQTWILGYIHPTKAMIEKYIQNGLVRKEDIPKFKHVDRVFPRNASGKCFILKEHLIAPIKRVVQKNGLEQEILEFDLLDEKGSPVNFAVIEPDLPLISSRAINDVNKGKAVSIETFEFIDCNYWIDIRVETKCPEEFVMCLVAAGRKYGLFGKTQKGYGKYLVYRCNP